MCRSMCVSNEKLMVIFYFIFTLKNYAVMSAEIPIQENVVYEKKKQSKVEEKDWKKKKKEEESETGEEVVT